MSRVAPPVRQPALDPRAAARAGLAVVVVLVLVYLGSGGLRWFDAALAGYLLGTLLAVFATVYRYTVWLQRPPTSLLNRRGWEAFRRRGSRLRNVTGLGGLVTTNLLGQSFVRHRSVTRWAAHQLVFWGCILAALITFPLTFGWLHFESAGASAATTGGRDYEAFVFDVATLSFDSRSPLGFLFFHLLNVAAFLVIGGVVLFLLRRMRDPGALAVERSGDFLALAGLFAVSFTGLMLTASSMWLEGRYYSFINTLHAVTVTLGLLYIPFGKLFHIFQRPANLGVAYYREAGAEGAQARCWNCGDEFVSLLQREDLKLVLPRVGLDYTAEAVPAASDNGEAATDGSSAGGSGYGNWQDTCPRCRRALAARAQTLRVGGFG